MSRLSLLAQAGATNGVESASEEVEEGALRLWETFLEALPRLGIGATFVFAGWVVARLVRIVLRRHWCRRQTPSFAMVMSKLASWCLLSLFVLAAVTVTFPSVKPVDLLAGFGFFSIAIGFAFQDILENTLSGVLLLFRQPFQGGDQIEVDGIEGVVEAITIRETRLVTFDGQLMVIPNADVYKNAIRVATARERRRDEFVVGVSYDADLDEAQRVIESALARVDGVADEPSPAALIMSLGVSTVDISARFWSDPHQGDLLRTRSRAISGVKTALDDAGIEMPSEIVELEATDSLRRALHLPSADGPETAE